LLIVKDLLGNEEALPDVKGVEVNEEVNGDFSISFTSFLTERNRYGYPLVQEESIIELEGQEFRIKKMGERRNEKSVHAQHVFFDLIDVQRYDIYGGTKTVDEFFAYVLTGTGWTFENVDVNYSALIPNFGEDNALSLLLRVCDAFGCEMKIEPNRHIRIFKEIGEDNDQQFRYKHNIETLHRSVDSSKLATVIRGYGGDGLEVTYTSPNAVIYGERHAEPVRDERFTVTESLIERCKQALVDVPEVSIELEVIQLGFQAGLGDKVWTIYEPMNIEFQQRVMARRWFPFSNRSPVVTLSNKKEPLTDQLIETRIEISENQKQTRSKFEQTNEKINLEVERIDESIAAVQIQADEVTISVQSLDNRVGSAEASLSIQAGQISSKVSYGDVMSAIVQSPESVKISAQRLDLDTIVRVNQELQLGYDGNGGTKAIKFNGYDTWIHTAGDGLVIDSLGSIVFYAPDVDFSSTNIVGLYARFG
jgi:phage minor structural protein